MNQKIGIGYDVHRLVAGKKLVLGGAEIPHSKGLDGHSDADVLLHAIADAILGALGKGDIGEHFPNTQPKYKNISSLVLVGKVLSLAQKEHFRVAHVDTIILAEEPNLKAFKPQMRRTIARALSMDEGSVNVKATTQEGMGFIGAKEGIAAYAVVLLEKDKI